MAYFQCYRITCTHRKFLQVIIHFSFPLAFIIIEHHCGLITACESESENGKVGKNGRVVLCRLVEIFFSFVLFRISFPFPSLVNASIFCVPWLSSFPLMFHFYDPIVSMFLPFAGQFYEFLIGIRPGGLRCMLQYCARGRAGDILSRSFISGQCSMQSVRESCSQAGRQASSISDICF